MTLLTFYLFSIYLLLTFYKFSIKPPSLHNQAALLDTFLIPYFCFIPSFLAERSILSLKFSREFERKVPVNSRFTAFKLFNSLENCKPLSLLTRSHHDHKQQKGQGKVADMCHFSRKSVEDKQKINRKLVEDILLFKHLIIRALHVFQQNFVILCKNASN